MDLGGYLLFLFLRRKDPEQKYLVLMKRLFSFYYNKPVSAILKFKFSCKKCKVYNPFFFLSVFFPSVRFPFNLSHFGIVSYFNCVFFV